MRSWTTSCATWTDGREAHAERIGYIAVMMPLGRRGLPLAIGLASAFAGLYIALQYHQLGLTLSHHDARGHLVVARRIVDSITPGWQQIGAVWLPLPHLLNAIPVQVDAWYRSGASAVGISILSFAVAV